jgi:glyoxylase-like metal-dependent hydrolase (beta-lactamase superfamily II)
LPWRRIPEPELPVPVSPALVSRLFRHTARVGLLAIAGVQLAHAQGGAANVTVEVFGSGREDAFFVTSSLIIGPTESVLWDAQYKVSDGKRLAEWIASKHTRLKAIVLSHADHDHYMGALEVVRRFPGTPVYMTRSGLDDFHARSASDLAAERKRPDNEAPDSLVTPQLLPVRLTVNDVAIEVIENLTGDVRAPASAALWIPSLRTALVGDVAFSGIHAWLGDSDYASRAAWRASLRKLAALGPTRVITGHKRDLTAADSPEVLTAMEQYITDFDAFMRASAAPQDVVKAMVEKYPDLALPVLMAYGARANFKK